MKNDRKLLACALWMPALVEAQVTQGYSGDAALECAADRCGSGGSWVFWLLLAAAVVWMVRRKG